MEVRFLIRATTDQAAMSLVAEYMSALTLLPSVSANAHWVSPVKSGEHTISAVALSAPIEESAVATATFTFVGRIAIASAVVP